MKQLKHALVAVSMLAGLGAALPASAQVLAGEYAVDHWPRYFSEVLRPMMAKMPMEEKKKVMEMEMAMAKMDLDHRATMVKMENDHRMAMMKARQAMEFRFLDNNGR